MVASAPEPEFDRAQYELLVALEAYEADLGPHGQLMSEATSSDGDPANKKRKFRFVAGMPDAPGLPMVDFAAKAQAEAMDAYYKKYPKESREGHLWVVHKQRLI